MLRQLRFNLLELLRHLLPRLRRLVLPRLRRLLHFMVPPSRTSALARRL
jgi:hypothetical protein